MNRFIHKYFLKNTIYLLLISLFWSNTISYYYWVLNTESALIEHSKTEKGESESELELEEKELDKLQMESYVPNFNYSIISLNALHVQDFYYLHHPEVSTPPPKLFFLI